MESERRLDRKRGIAEGEIGGRASDGQEAGPRALREAKTKRAALSSPLPLTSISSLRVFLSPFTFR
jgi:hypothetical protein